MKLSLVIPGLALVILIPGAILLHRAVQHARQDRVSLNVIQAPLPGVLKRVARQTRESIVANPALEGPITLQVHRAPLREVLGRIADQTGGFARLNLAVGESAAAIKRLQDDILKGHEPEKRGWTNLSARPEFEKEPAPEARIIRRDTDAAAPSPPPGATGPEGAWFDRRIIRGGTHDSERHGVGVEIQSRGDGPAGTRVNLITTSPDGTVHTLDLSPVRLLVDERLAARLASGQPMAATEETAARLARETGGTWASFYTLESLPLPPGRIPPGLNEWTWKPSAPGPGDAPTPESMEAHARRHRFERLNRLTPEERARASGVHEAVGAFEDVEVNK